MNPLLIAAGVQAGGSVLSGLLGGGPDTPDVVSPALRAAERRRRAAERSFDRRSDRLEGTLAATGVSGSGAAAQRERLYRTNANQQSKLDARLLDSINQARAQQEQMEYEAGQRKAQARAQAMGNISQVAGMVAADQFGGGGEGGGISDGTDLGNVDPLSEETAGNDPGGMLASIYPGERRGGALQRLARSYS